MESVAAKLRTAVIVLLGLGGLLADLHCDSLELLLLKVTLWGSVIKMSFVGSRDHTVCSPPRSSSLSVPVATKCKM
jgi:hypothetical protein